MVKVYFDSEFKKSISKIKNIELKIKIKKLIKKLIQNPELGKPMKYTRKGTRELYSKPFRLSYIYENDSIIILAYYHKDNQ